MLTDAFAWSPTVTATALGFTLAGIALGTVSGLVPGLHANTMALVLAGVAPSLPGPPRYVVCAMLAAGVVHTFLDVVPTLALGVPDPAMAVGALPGHRLVIQGRGHETLRLSALGSGLAIVFAVPLAVPVTRVMVAAYPIIERHLGVLLLATATLLVVTESSYQAAVAVGQSTRRADFRHYAKTYRTALLNTVGSGGHEPTTTAASSTASSASDSLAVSAYIARSYSRASRWNGSSPTAAAYWRTVSSGRRVRVRASSAYSARA